MPQCECRWRPITCKINKCDCACHTQVVQPGHTAWGMEFAFAPTRTITEPVEPDFDILVDLHDQYKGAWHPEWMLHGAQWAKHSS